MYFLKLHTFLSLLFIDILAYAPRLDTICAVAANVCVFNIFENSIFKFFLQMTFFNQAEHYL